MNNQLTYDGLGSIELWVNAMPEDYLHLKIYSGRFTQRGKGKPVVKLKADSHEDLIHQIQSQLSGGVNGLVTINISNRSEGGTDGLTRYINLGSTSNGISGIGAINQAQQIGYVHPLQVQQQAADQANALFESWKIEHMEQVEKERETEKRFEKLEQKYKKGFQGPLMEFFLMGKENPEAFFGGVKECIGLLKMMVPQQGSVQVAKQIMNKPIEENTAQEAVVNTTPTKDELDRYNATVDEAEGIIEDAGIPLDTLLTSIKNIVTANDENIALFKDRDNLLKLEALFTDPVKMQALKAFM